MKPEVYIRNYVREINVNKTVNESELKTGVLLNSKYQISNELPLFYSWQRLSNDEAWIKQVCGRISKELHIEDLLEILVIQLNMQVGMMCMHSFPMMTGN